MNLNEPNFTIFRELEKDHRKPAPSYFPELECTRAVPSRMNLSKQTMGCVPEQLGEETGCYWQNKIQRELSFTVF